MPACIFWPSLFILGVAHDSFENNGEQKSIHLQTAAAVFLKEDRLHIIGNYIQQLDVEGFNFLCVVVWYCMMATVQMIGFGSTLFMGIWAKMHIRACERLLLDVPRLPVSYDFPDQPGIAPRVTSGFEMKAL